MTCQEFHLNRPLQASFHIHIPFFDGSAQSSLERQNCPKPTIPAELPCDSHQTLQKANIALSSSAPKAALVTVCFQTGLSMIPHAFVRVSPGDFRLLTGIIYCPWLFLALGDGISLGMGGICLSGKVSLLHSSSRIERK